MNEPLFELHYTRSVDQVKEAQRYMFRKRPSAIAMHVLVIICVVLNLALWFWRGDPVNLIAAMCVVLIVLLRGWFYHWTLQNVDRREEEMFHGCPPEVTVRIYDDRVESEGLGAKTNTAISSFRRIYRTDRLIVPHTKGNLMFLLPEDAFTKGSAEECVRFFASKGIKVS